MSSLPNTVETIRPRDGLRPDIGRSLDAIRVALEDMRFGAITLSVHDGRVVQLDVTERTRFSGGSAN